MRYDELKEKLEDLERRVPASFPQDGNLGQLVRSEPDRAIVQAYGLSKTSHGENCPIIVAVGINYTQDRVKCPRDPQNNDISPIAVEDGLKICRINVAKALHDYHSRPERWVSTGNASSIGIPSFEKFHFVATNFCLWITKKKWGDLAAGERRLLLDNNPHFAGKPTAAPSWHHLTALAEALAGESVLWVPHGLKNEVFSLFEGLRNTLGGSHWIKTPNLSYPYTYKMNSHPR